MKIEDYKIGDEMFRYIDGGGIFRYVVIGRREREQEIQLEVECKTCSHGWKCQLLLAKDDYGRIFVVHMLNNDDEHDQRMWHTNDGFYFCRTADEAKQQKLVKLVAHAEEQVRKAEDSLRAAKARLAEVKGLAEGVQP